MRTAKLTNRGEERGIGPGSWMVHLAANYADWRSVADGPAVLTTETLTISSSQVAIHTPDPKDTRPSIASTFVSPSPTAVAAASSGWKTLGSQRLCSGTPRYTLYGAYHVEL